MRGQRLKWFFAILAIAAVLWLTNTPSTQTTPPTTPHATIETPQWQAHQVDQWQAASNGQMLHLRAVRATHYRQTLRTLLEQPEGILLTREAEYSLQADRGTATPTTLLLSGHARLTRRAPNTSFPLTLQSTVLQYDHTLAHLKTEEPVRITQGPHWTRGTGLSWWLQRQQLTIERDVTSEFAPPSS